MKRGSSVCCVEPNDDMRNTAEKELVKYAGFHAVKGTASQTMLDSHSVDFITTAQAFHWFDVLEFKKECSRILKPDGRIFLIWNMRDMSCEINKKSYEIYSMYCPAFKGFGGGIQKDDPRIKEFFDDNYEYIEFEHPLVYDKEKFISRILSGSYSLKTGDERYEEYMDALIRLFDYYADNEKLVMPNKTVVYTGRRKEQNE